MQKHSSNLHRHGYMLAATVTRHHHSLLMSFQLPHCDDALERGRPRSLQGINTEDDLEAESDHDDTAWVAFGQLVCDALDVIVNTWTILLVASEWGPWWRKVYSTGGRLSGTS